MKKYFHLYNYSSSLKVRMTVYNLNDKATIWWKDLKKVKNIEDKRVEWKQFKNYFKRKYM